MVEVSIERQKYMKKIRFEKRFKELVSSCLLYHMKGKFCKRTDRKISLSNSDNSLLREKEFAVRNSTHKNIAGDADSGTKIPAGRSDKSSDRYTTFVELLTDN